MTITEFYTAACEKEFMTHKINFVEKTNFTEKNKKISAEDLLNSIENSKVFKGN